MSLFSVMCITKKEPILRLTITERCSFRTHKKKASGLRECWREGSEWGLGSGSDNLYIRQIVYINVLPWIHGLLIMDTVLGV